MSTNFFQRFTTYDIILISILSAIGLAIKPIVTPIIHLVSVPLMIPGGSLAGGFYMMWIALTGAIVNKFGSMFLVALIQSILIIIMGFFGNHGAISLITYSVPGIVAETTGLFFRRKNTLTAQTFICSSANLSGVVLVTTIIMRLALIPFLISIVSATISGIVGGIISFNILSKLKKLDLV